MAIKVSTGLRNAMLATGSFKATMDGMVCNIYEGTAPATADAAIGAATLLCTVSLNSTGTGVNWDTAAVAGALAKAPAEVWSGVNAATGTAQFFRFMKAADANAESAVEPRVQGTVATAGADLNFSSTSLTSGATQTIDSYTMALPTL